MGNLFSGKKSNICRLFRHLAVFEYATHSRLHVRAYCELIHISCMADIHTLDFFLVHTVDTLTLFSQFDIVISSFETSIF